MIASDIPALREVLPLSSALWFLPTVPDSFAHAMQTVDAEPDLRQSLILRNAVTTYVQNRCGSSSVSSRVIQATE